MIWNFIKIAWRHLTKNPVITFIQIFGLTVGLTVFLLISLWVNNQLSFDKFGGHENRVCRVEFYSPEYSGWTEQPLALGPVLQREIVGVEKAVRIKYGGFEGKLSYQKEQNPDKIIEVTYKHLLFADSTFFEVFPFQFIYGNPKTALLDPQSIVLQESVAKKLFNKEYPIGKQVTYQNNIILTVTGVIKDVNNSHIPFKTVIPFSLMKQHYKNSNIEWDSWTTFMHPTYVLLAPHVSSRDVGMKATAHLIEMFKKTWPDVDNSQIEYRLRPLKNIYFHGKTEKEYSYVLHGNFRLMAGLTGIAILILLLAVINFINLNTTRTFFRSKETGIRKIVGSDRRHVFIQFSGEIIAMCAFVLILSVVLVHLLLPYYNNLIGTDLYFSELFTTSNLLVIFGSFLLLVLLSGVIPSWLLSSCSPVTVLRNLAMYSAAKGQFTRKVLLVAQYAITIIVLTVTVLVHKQIHFMKNSDPGFNLENVLRYGYPILKYKDKMNTFRERLLDYPGIKKVAYTMTVPGINFQPGANYNFAGKIAETYGFYTYPEIFDLLEIPIIHGRNFISGHIPDQAVEGNSILRVLLNETAVKDYGLKNPVGTMGITNSNQKVEIIGVVKDFHCTSLKSAIPPTIFTYWPGGGYYFLIKTAPNDIKGIKAHINKVYEEFNMKEPNPGRPYLADLYNNQYESEEKLGEMFIWFSLLSILIAALGMYGISANAIHRRVREIGLRKANGASVWDIMKLIQFYFGKIVFWSGLFALPVAWYLASRWLINYPYKTKLSWWIFAGSLLLAILVAIATTGWKTWKAATRNPIETLRYE